MPERQLLIAGASGIIGQAILEAFAQAGFGQMILRSDEVLLANLEDMRRRRLIP